MLKREPAVGAALVTAVLDALALFVDIGLDSEQKGAVVVVVTMIAGFFIRSRVTPVPPISSD